MARRDHPQDFPGIPARSGDHAVDELLGWRYDRQAIGPAMLKILFNDVDGASHCIRSGELRRRFSGNHVSFLSPWLSIQGQKYARETHISAPIEVQLSALLLPDRVCRATA